MQIYVYCIHNICITIFKTRHLANMRFVGTESTHLKNTKRCQRQFDCIRYSQITNTTSSLCCSCRSSTIISSICFHPDLKRCRAITEGFSIDRHIRYSSQDTPANSFNSRGATCCGACQRSSRDVQVV